jgi:hypothetical protein
MRQLVGLLCVLCGKPVGSIVEGRFCPGCGCPVHDQCILPAEGRAPEYAGCRHCGAQSDAVEREQDLHRQEARNRVVAAKQRRGLRLIGLCALVSLYGGVRLVGYLITTKERDFGGVGDASAPLLLGIVAMVSIFIWMARNTEQC